MSDFHENDWTPDHCTECSSIIGYHLFDGEPRSGLICEECWHEMRRDAERTGGDPQ